MDIPLDRRPLFVVGTGRCGTTLLTDLIQGPRIHCLKERQVPSRFPHFGGQHIFNLLYRGDIPEPVFLAHFREVRLKLLEGHRPEDIYCEKIPHGQWAIETIKRVFPTARFLEIYRDGRDTVQSMLHVDWYAPEDTRPRWMPRGELDAWQRLGQFEKCVTRLARTIPFTILNRLSYDASDYLGFSYEELMAEPESVVQRIEEFVGTDLHRGRVELRPSGGKWKGWSCEQRETYDRILGEDGRRAQAFLGYETCSTYSYS